MKILAAGVEIPIEVLVYGATCIHHSKRPLLNNYFNYIEKKNRLKNAVAVYSCQNQPMTILTIQSTKIERNAYFANNDVSISTVFVRINRNGIPQWKLDRVIRSREKLCPKWAKLFVNARNEIEAGTWTTEKSASLELQVRALHPEVRGLEAGFYLLNPEDVK